MFEDVNHQKAPSFASSNIPIPSQRSSNQTAANSFSHASVFDDDFEFDDDSMLSVGHSSSKRPGECFNQPLFTTDIPEQMLNLGSVLIRDVHVLRKFDIVNLDDSEIVVSLSSSLSEQIGFQITNENLEGDLDEEDHNQLFNTINRINEVVVGPLQRQTIIVSYLPEMNSDNSFGVRFHQPTPPPPQTTKCCVSDIFLVIRFPV